MIRRLKYILEVVKDSYEWMSKNSKNQNENNKLIKNLDLKIEIFFVFKG
jgi:hypothetical protein